MSIFEALPWAVRVAQDVDTIHTFIEKFGRNTDVDTAAAEDIWDGGGVYAFPSAAAATTIVSSDGADDVGGTGALTVEVQGLDASNVLTTETVVMTGAVAVTLATEYKRVFRAKVVTAGSGEVNAGNIQIKHGATVLAQISIGMGQTLMAIYTVPAGFAGYLLGFYASMNRRTATTCDIFVQVREAGEAWNTKMVIGLNSAASSYLKHDYPVPIPRDGFAAGTDIRMRAEVGANDVDISAGFTMLLKQV
jgi:hypothetical protein